MAYGQIVTMKLQDGNTVEFADWSDKPLYSSINLLDGATTQEMTFFSYVQGDPVPSFAPGAVPVTPRTANERDTNMAVPAALSSEEEFLVFSIRPEVFCLSVTDPSNPDFSTPAALTALDIAATPGMLSALGLYTLLYLEISEKRFPQAGFGYFNFGAGMNITGGDTSAVAGQQGWASQDAVRTLTIPSHIGGTEKFRVVLFNPDGVALPVGFNLGGQSVETATRFAIIRIYLDGLYRRGTA
jgi:hypothetical protein